MNRRLVLLCNPGSQASGNYISHIPVILNRYKTYFQSPVGGYWHDSEICEMPDDLDDTKQYAWLSQIVMLCNSATIDYSLFVFIGHGGEFQDGECIQLSKGYTFSLNIILGKNQANRASLIKRTVIIDACRDYHPVPASQLTEDLQIFENSNLNGELCEGLYNSTIEQADPHVELLQSTSSGNYALSTQTGTLFSDAFLGFLNRHVPFWNSIVLAQQNGQMVKNLEEIFPEVVDLMKVYNQLPQYRSNPSKTERFPIYSVFRDVTKCF